MNTVLMGLRGSGKSTVGRAVAALLGRTFVELDDRVLAAFAEGSVEEVWSVHGEPAWRAAEAKALAECLTATDQVIALGGGTPMIADARRLLENEREAGRVRIVYLVCDPQELTRRLTRTPGDRPPLLGGDAVSEIEPVHADRDPVYRRLADLEFEVAGLTTEAAADALADRLKPG